MALRGIPGYRRLQAPSARSLASVGAAAGPGAALAEFLARTGVDLAGDAQAADAEKVALAATAEGHAAGMKAGQGGAAPVLLAGDTVHAKAFNDAVMGGYVASLDVYTHSQATQWAAEHANDPEGFRVKWDGLSAGILKQQPAALAPQVQAELAKRGTETYAHLVSVKAKRDLKDAEDKSNGTMAQAMLQHEQASDAAWRAGDAKGAAAADASWAEYLSKRTDFSAVGKVEAQDAFRRTRQRSAVLGEFDRIKARGLGAAEAFIRDFAKPGAHQGIAADDAVKLSAEMERGLADLRARHAQAVGDLRGQAEDALYRATRGYGAGNLPDLVNRARALGETDMANRLAESQRGVELAGELAKMPLPALRAKVSELDGLAKGGSDRASAQRAEVAKGVLADVTQAMGKDAIAHVRAQGADLPKVDWAKPETLKARAAAADRLSRINAVAIPTLDNAEAEDLAVRMDGATPDEKAQMLGNLYQGFGVGRLPEVLEIIKQKQPEAAHAGALMAQGADGQRVARDILFGAELRKSVGKDGAAGGRQYMPPKDEAFRTRLAELLPHDTVAGLSPDDLAGLESAVLSSYAAKSHAAGLAQQSTVNLPLIRKAVADVTGGVVEFNGKPIFAPVRGMNQDAFDTVMQGLTDDDLGGAQSIDGYKVSAAQVRKHGQLRMVEPGRYLVRIGDGFLVAPDHRPVVLDLGAKAKGAR